MQSSDRFVWIGLGGVGLVLASVFVTRWSMQPGPMPDATPLEVAAHSEGDAALAGALADRNKEIAELRDVIGRLNERIAAMGSARSEVTEESREESPQQTTKSAADSAEHAQALAYLRGLLPEKYADYSLEELAMLRELEMGGEGVTDEALAALSALTHLRNLNLRGAHITDAGLAYLSDDLENLTLRGTGVTGLGLANLRTTNLESLHLCDTHVTGDELFRLPPMPNLKQLKLNFLDLDDSAVEAIGNYPNVRHLEMDQTRLTDAGLWRLLSLNPNLTRIELRGTKVTTEGVKAVNAEYPGCELVTDSGRFMAGMGH